jgi:hypothetical protein
MSYFNWDDNFRLNVARGKVRGASMVHRFGASPEIAQASTATLWDKVSTLYPWSAFVTAGVIVAGIANASDNGKKVVVYGLDSNYEEIQEEFTLSSTATVTGTVSFKRIYGAYLSNGSSNVGDVTFTKGGTDVVKIIAGRGSSSMAIYTVPAGKTGYLYKGVCTAQASADGTGDMYVRYVESQAFRVGHTFEVSSGGEYDYEFSFPIRLPEKTDIDVRVTTRANKGRYTAAYDILLLEE